MREIFIQQMPPCSLAWMANVAWLSSQALGFIFTALGGEYSVLVRASRPIRIEYTSGNYTKGI